MATKKKKSGKKKKTGKKKVTRKRPSIKRMKPTKATLKSVGRKVRKLKKKAESMKKKKTKMWKTSKMPGAKMTSPAVPPGSKKVHAPSTAKAGMRGKRGGPLILAPQKKRKDTPATLYDIRKDPRTRLPYKKVKGFKGGGALIKKPYPVPVKGTKKTIKEGKGGKYPVEAKAAKKVTLVEKKLGTRKPEKMTAKSWFAKLAKTKRGKLALAAAGIGAVAGAIGLTGGKKKKASAEPVRTEVEEKAPEPMAKAPEKAPEKAPQTAPKAKPGAKVATKAPVVKAKTVKPQRISGRAGERVMKLRQRYNIPSGGSITGEEAFVAAAATAIGGQVPGLYKTADQIAGFLGQNLKPLGLAGLAGGATYVIARYLSRRRRGQSFLGEGRDIVRRAKTQKSAPSGRARRPATSMYKKGVSAKRKRATGGY